MRIFSMILGAALLASAASAQEETVAERWDADRTTVFEAAEIDLNALRWVARPLIVFGESPFDPQFLQQLDLLTSEIGELSERDVIIITDTDPEARSDLRQQYRPRSFMLVLIGKDGQIKLRKPAPWDVRELSRSIDKTPLRQQEIRDRRVVSE